MPGGSLVDVIGFFKLVTVPCQLAKVFLGAFHHQDADMIQGFLVRFGQENVYHERAQNYQAVSIVKNTDGLLQESIKFFPQIEAS